MAITCSVLLRLIPVRAGDIKAISRYSVHPSQMSWYTYIMFKRRMELSRSPISSELLRAGAGMLVVPTR